MVVDPGCVLHGLLTSCVAAVVVFDTEGTYLHWWLLLLVCTEWLFYKTARMDPGFLRLPDSSFQLPVCPAVGKDRSYKTWASKSFHFDLSNHSGLAPWPPQLVLPVLNCYLCELSVPLRARHCLTCGRCVSRFDHHCPWFGQCIGRRNHRYFVLFMIAQSVLIVLTCIMLGSSLQSPASLDLSTWFWSNKFRLVSLAVCTVAVLISSGLGIFHVLLALLDKTTWEVEKASSLMYTYFFTENPFQRSSYVGNLRRFFFPPSDDCEHLDQDDVNAWWRAFARRNERLLRGNPLATQATHDYQYV